MSGVNTFHFTMLGIVRDAIENAVPTKMVRLWTRLNLQKNEWSRPTIKQVHPHYVCYGLFNQWTLTLMSSIEFFQSQEMKLLRNDTYDHHGMPFYNYFNDGTPSCWLRCRHRHPGISP